MNIQCKMVISLIVGILKKIQIKYKLGFLIFMCHLEGCLDRAYSQLKKRFKKQHSYGYSSIANDEAAAKCCVLEDLHIQDDSREPVLFSVIKGYRKLTNVIHIINFFKYIFIILILDENSLPLSYNCYLVGRLLAHSSLIDYLPALALFFLVLFGFWRYQVKYSQYSLELDLAVFTLQEPETIYKELSWIKNWNRLPLEKSELVLCPRNILQRVLVYQVDYDSFSRYRLRPNRTRKCKTHLNDLINTVLCYLLLSWIIGSLVTLPGIVSTSLYDVNFIRNYPTCCPTIDERAKFGLIQAMDITSDGCLYRFFSIPFDVMDNMFIYFDTALLMYVPICLSLVITNDLIIYWSVIDIRVNKLLNSLKQSVYTEASSASEPMKDDYYHLNDFHEYSQTYLITVSCETSPPLIDSICVCEIIEIQSLLNDFFYCSGRADRFINIQLTYLVSIFVGSHIIMGYVSLRVNNFWELTLVQTLFLVIYSLLMISARILLRLKKAIDKTHVKLCSSMSLDYSIRKTRWIPILENYTTKKRNSFTVAWGIPFNWTFVLNLSATCLSCLLAIETFKMH